MTKTIKIEPSGNKSLTFNFMFLIEILLYYPKEALEALDLLESSDNDLNVYIQDEAFQQYNYATSDKYFYFIKVRDDLPNFTKGLNLFKKNNPFYVTHYKAGSGNSNYSIIVSKVIITDRFKKMMNSNYSKMFTDKELSSLYNTMSILDRYTYKENMFELDLPEFKNSFEKYNIIIHTIGHTMTLRKCLENHFNLPEKSLFDQEYYRKFKPDDEIINSKNL